MRKLDRVDARLRNALGRYAPYCHSGSRAAYVAKALFWRDAWRKALRKELQAAHSGMPKGFSMPVHMDS